MPLKGIVTDGVNYYPEIIDELAVPHQQCTFHKMQNLMKPIQKTINKNKLKIQKRKEKIEKLEQKKIKLEKSKGTVKRGRISKKDKKRIKTNANIKKTKKEIRKLKKEIKQYQKENKEYKHYKEHISRIFKSKNPKTAEKRFQKILDKIEQIPEEIATFIKKLKNNLQRTINHTKYKFLPSTNNLIELYYKTTLPKPLKRKYRTINGLTTRLRMSKIRWHQRNTLKTKT